jgi:hypothetical protein
MQQQNSATWTVTVNPQEHFISVVLNFIQWKNEERRR